MWIPILGWILAPFLLVLAVGAGLSALVPSGKAAFQCRNCKSWFAVPKKELPA